MTLVGSSPPPRGPDDGPEGGDSPDAGGHDAASREARGEEESGWVAPGAPTGGEHTDQGQTPPWWGPGPAAPGEGQPPPPGEPSPRQDPASPGSGEGWAPPAPGEGQRQTPPGEPAGWSGAGQAQGWGPPPQPALGGNAGWGSPGYQPPVSLPKAGSARTGPLPLHPMSFTDILDGAFRLLKANLATIVLVTAVFFVPLELLSAFLSRDLLGGQSFLQMLQDPSLTEQELGTGLSGIRISGIAATSLLRLLITPFVGGAITQVVAASYLGQQLSAGDAIKTTGRRFWALLGAAILVHLVEGVGLVLCVLPALVAMAFLVCTTPAVVIESLGPIKSMRRSFALVRPRFWPVLGIAVVSGLLASFLTSVLGTPFTFAAELVGLRWGFLLLALGSIVPVLFASPFVSIVATLVYFDARIRHEGFDLQMIAGGLADGDAPAY
jgi:hypothetical protein